ncbi:hypothetical protein [Corallococcus sp. AB049A]|uniref:hypothetical protein n=1 Tax=Corallococcus sp. AB049A TaxID=2316721 RepID=UPI0011C35E37|nr:hypothetical protein [Corallococcus sp. AB049A]
MPLKATDVFTPNDFPVHTYIQRAGEDLEGQLRRALATPKQVVSLSGPSKSGKTVLVEKVVGKDNLIQISGAMIKEPEDLWNLVLDWMEVPHSEVAQAGATSTHQSSVKGGGKAGIPFLTEASGEAAYQYAKAKTETASATLQRRGLAQVEKEIAGSAFVIFVDDFHYMDRGVQVSAAQQIKAAAERGVRICVASVPHRADDVVRSNPELRGRTANIDTAFWGPDQLSEIARVGFKKLNMTITDADAVFFATEACGSPQIMQSLCLQTCFITGTEEEQAKQESLTLNTGLQRRILLATSTVCDYSSLVGQMHQGPKTRGTERKEFIFKDESKGDVYRAVLLALAADPPRMDFPWAEISKRIESVCAGGTTPVGSSYAEACKQISTIALNAYPAQRIIEWDENASVETLTIVDPYLLFFLRSSPKLASLGKGK